MLKLGCNYTLVIYRLSPKYAVSLLANKHVFTVGIQLKDSNKEKEAENGYCQFLCYVMRRQLQILFLNA